MADMTRRAFSALRVIRLEGHVTSILAQVLFSVLEIQMDIAQNPCVRLTPDQFLYLPQAKTYPGMYSLCPSMRFRKSYIDGKIFCDTEKVEIFMKS